MGVGLKMVFSVNFGNEKKVAIPCWGRGFSEGFLKHGCSVSRTALCCRQHPCPANCIIAVAGRSKTFTLSFCSFQCQTWKAHTNLKSNTTSVLNWSAVYAHFKECNFLAVFFRYFIDSVLCIELDDICCNSHPFLQQDTKI